MTLHYDLWLLNYVDLQMKEIKKERAPLVKMIWNAKSDGVEYQDWPQYFLFLELTSKWYAYREIKEMLQHVINPSLEVHNKEIFEALGI